MQEQGFASALPLGACKVEVERMMTTPAAAVFLPFISYEIKQCEASALFYGRNALTSNSIIADRKSLKNPNGLILGVPGSGKSFAAKWEMLGAYLMTADDIMICDPEAEYHPLMRALGGQVIKIAQGSGTHINPMDINLSCDGDESPISLKADFILSMCELILGGRNGLEPVEKTIIDRAAREVYRKYLAAPSPDNMPILKNLYDEIKAQPEKEAKRIAAALEIYVHGSLNIFNNRTNIDVQNRLVCFDIKNLGAQLKALGMLIVQDQIWNRVTVNRETGKSTWYYMDEFHLLLREPQTAAYSAEIYKRFRKWGGIPTGITQNVKDLLASREVENIFENSDFMLMLSQAPKDRVILADALGISEKQMEYVTHTKPGNGLLFYGNKILPFTNKLPDDSRLYSIMTTRFGETGTGAL
jgi:type IV secretory pathway VirB4 component